MTQKQKKLLQKALAQAQQGVQVSVVEQTRLDSVLEASDSEFNASVEKLSKVGL
jgi:predicted Zn-dependent protease